MNYSRGLKRKFCPNQKRSKLLSLERLENRQMLTIVAEVVADIRPGTKGSEIGSELFEYKGELYFSADDGQRGKELWKTDGTRDGTQLVKDIHLGDEDADSIPGWFVEHNNEIFFAAFSDANGDELWKSDGTPEGTELVSDINPGAEGSRPGELVLFNDEIYFAASDGLDNDELWKSDGTDAGTELVADIRAGRSSSPGSSSGLYEFNGYLYFNARDNDNGVELWRSDGTAEGTTLVLDADPGETSSWPSDFFEFRGDLYFIAETLNPEFDRFFAHLFRVDHDSGTAVQAVDMPIELLEGVLVSGDHMYFAGLRDDVGFELFRSDGTDAGTTLMRDAMSGSGDSNPRNFFEHNGKVYFAASDSRESGTERLIYNLWSTDGTPFGTRKVSPIEIYAAGSFVSYEDELYFTGRSEEFGWELHKTNGTTNGTQLVHDIATGAEDSQALPKHVFGGQLVLIAETSEDGWEIWTYDGANMTMIETHQGGGDFTDNPDNFRFLEYGDDLVFIGSNPFDGEELNILRSTATNTQRLAGDADGNGKVEFADFLLLSTNFGKQDAVWADGDFDDNGNVEFADFLLLSTNFGKSLG